jgi:Ca-activated chloride channel family protein
MIKLTIISTLLMASNLALPADNDGPIVPRIAREQSIAASLRVNVNMVLVPVSVTDLYGRSVTGLQARNFRVIEGANEVPIVSFGREDQPIAVGLVFDCSRSMADKFQTAHQAPRELFQQLNPQRRELSDYRLRQSGIEERPHFRV